MYHCLELGKCLPLFNHFCNALNVPVYLETVKPYLSFLFLLSLDGFVVLGSCVWAWSDQQLRSAAIEGSLLFLATLLFCYAGFMLWQVGRTMAVRNIVWPELGRDGEFRGTYMAAQEETPNRVVVRWRCESALFYGPTIRGLETNIFLSRVREQPLGPRKVEQLLRPDGQTSFLVALVEHTSRSPPIRPQCCLRLAVNASWAAVRPEDAALGGASRCSPLISKPQSSVNHPGLGCCALFPFVSAWQR